MKTTKILLAVIALFIFSSSSVFAQSARLSIGFEWAAPQGTFGDAFGMGYGGSARFEMPLAGKLALFGTAGFISVGDKNSSNITETFIPVHVGAKIYFMEQQNGLYVLGQLGVHITSVDYNGSSTSSTDFSYAPGIGYHLSKLDIGVNYQIISATGGSADYISTRLAFVLGGK
jgi:hypothetical protein